MLDFVAVYFRDFGDGQIGRVIMQTRLMVAVCVALAVFVGVSSLGAQGGSFRLVTDAMLQDPDPADWLNWRRTLDGWGYSPLDEITAENAEDLQLAWSWGLTEGSQQTTPLVYYGVMYLANPGAIVQALDAATGDLIWEYRRGEQSEHRSVGGPGPGRMHRNIAIYQDKIYLNTSDAHIVAIDARSGEEIWSTDVGGGAGYQYSSGSIVADGRIVSGLTGCGQYRDDT